MRGIKKKNLFSNRVLVLKSSTSNRSKNPLKVPTHSAQDPQHTKGDTKMKVLGRQNREDCLPKKAEGDAPVAAVETTIVNAGKAALIPSSSSDRRKETAPTVKVTGQALSGLTAGTAAASEVATSCNDVGSLHSAVEIRKKKRALLESSGSSRGHRGGPGAALSLLSLAAAEEEQGHADVGGGGLPASDDDLERSENGVRDPDPDAPTQKRTRRATEIETGERGTVEHADAAGGECLEAKEAKRQPSASMMEASVAWAMAAAAAQAAEAEASDAAFVAAMTAAQATRAAAELAAAEAAVAVLKERAAKAKAAAARGKANAAKAAAEAAAADALRGSNSQVEDIEANAVAKRASQVFKSDNADGNGRARAGQAATAATNSGVVEPVIAVAAGAKDDATVMEVGDGTPKVLSGADLPVDGIKSSSKVAGGPKKKKSVKTYRGKIKTDIPCRIKGCSEMCHSAYSARSRVCLTHIRASAVEIDGVMSRFCQKCTRFHSVDAFRPTNRTCSMQLDKTSKNSKCGENTEINAGGAVVKDGSPRSDLAGEMTAKMTVEKLMMLHSHASAAASIPPLGFTGGMPWGAATTAAWQAAFNPTMFDSSLLSSFPVSAPLANAITGRGGGGVGEGGGGGGEARGGGRGTTPRTPVSAPGLEQEEPLRRRVVAKSKNKDDDATRVN